jgi:hypothetical protein
MTVVSSRLPLLLDETFKVFSRFIAASVDSMTAVQRSDWQ